MHVPFFHLSVTKGNNVIKSPFSTLQSFFKAVDRVWAGQIEMVQEKNQERTRNRLPGRSLELSTRASALTGPVSVSSPLNNLLLYH